MTSPAPRRRAHARVLVTGLLAVLSLALGPTLAASADPSPSPSTAAQLSDAQGRATRLASQVATLERQAEAAAERYDDASTTLTYDIEAQLAARSTLKDLQSAAVTQQAHVVDRARAVYESGGPLTQYATVLSANGIGDLGDRLVVVHNVAATSRLTTEAAATAVDAATTAQTSLENLVADQESQSRAASAAKDAVTDLLAQTQALQAGADADVTRLAAQAQAEAEAAKEAAFRAQLATAGGTAVPAGVLATFAELATRPDGVAADPLNAAAFAAIQKYVGRPYVWGGTGPVGYDCSGLVGQAFADAGVVLPRVGHLQYLAGTHPTLADLHAGDLLFWSDSPTDYNAIEHVAMYAGSGLMVSANHTGDTVRLQPVWDASVFGFTRVDAATAASVPGGRWAPGQTGA